MGNGLAYLILHNQNIKCSLSFVLSGEYFIFLSYLIVLFYAGCIVNVSSVNSDRASTGLPVYCMTKAALQMFTDVLASGE